jgi:hypothetical protein
MMKSTEGVIDYYGWLLSDWADLGGVRLVQMARRQAGAQSHPDAHAGRLSRKRRHAFEASGQSAMIHCRDA